MSVYELNQFGVILAMTKTGRAIPVAQSFTDAQREEARKLIDLANDCERIKGVLRAMGAKEKA